MKINNIFEKIISNSKNCQNLMLVEEKKTYNDLYLNTKKIYKFLKKNLKKDEIICVCLNYSFDFMSIILASYLNKNPVTFLNPFASKKEKKHVISDSKCSIIIYEKNNLKYSKSKKFLSFKYKVLKKLEKNNLSFRFLIYTSGTTANPKGVMLSTSAISSNVKSINNNINLKKNDTGIIFSPPAYAMGVSQVLSFLLSKSKFVLFNSGLRFPVELKEKIKKYKISILNLSISALRILNKYLKKNEKFNFVKIVMAGGMQFTTTEYNLYKKIFPKALMINFYGCTENSPRISHYHINSKKNFKGIFPVGKPLNGVKVKIKNLSNSKIGKIFISGTSLMNGYYNLNKINEQKIIKNWFDTGDLGFFDKKRDLYLIGRCDNIFRVGHEKLYPEELESEIKLKLKIENVIISKIKDKILNWVPVCVILDYNKKEISEKIFTLLKKNFSSFKVPKKIISIKEFPKTNYGKIDRVKLEQKIKKIYEQ